VGSFEEVKMIADAKLNYWPKIIEDVVKERKKAPEFLTDITFNIKYGRNKVCNVKL